MTSSTGRLLLVLLCIGVAAAATARPARTAMAQAPGPTRIHILPPPQAPQRRPNVPQTNLQYSGGPVVHAGTVYAIYWLPAGVVTSASYQTLINRYFTDVGATSLYNIVTQYPDTCCPPGNTSVSGNAWLDATAYPGAGTPADPLLDSDIETEVLLAISANPSWNPPGPDTMYFVYTGRNVYSCTDASKTICFLAQYCAYHGSFVSGSATILYANMPDAGTDLSRCSIGPGPNGDPEADAEISIASHEHFEIVTDPQPNVNTAWSDAAGFEIGDKCAYTYGTLNPDNSNVLLHGHPYRVQQEWSNALTACTLSLLSLAPSVGGIAEEAVPAQSRAPVASGDGTWTRALLYAGAVGAVVLAGTVLRRTRHRRAARR